MKKLLILSFILSFVLLANPCFASHLKDVNIATQDSEALDAFGRFRVSQPFNVFDMQFNYDLQPLFFEESATGGGDVTHVPALSSARLTTGGTTDTHGVIFQTGEYFRYQPGKSQFVVWTCILGSKTSNVRKRIGYFDSENGFFFEQDGTNLKIIRRTKTSGSIVDNAVNQSSWNLDVLDGSGKSGVTLDETKDNIYVIDFQWLGAGRIRFGFDFGGQITYVHQIKFANTEAVPFSVAGNLPFRAEIFNTATAAGTTTFDFTCVAITSEGGFNPLGIPGSVSNGVTERTVSTTPLPILSIKMADTFNSITNRSLIEPLSYEIYSLDENIFYQIILNGSLTNASFNAVDATNSAVVFDVAATAISGGFVIDSGFLTGARDKKEAGIDRRGLLAKLFMAQNIAGNSGDILSIVMTRMAAADASCSAAFTWEEFR
ncbi:hypothetical protein LCGC14_0435140 [marine sediment metagenome]|uniref:Uncharacterized protein n=1 Tax=marine sediment metagenome TaxID=412755 RepID=A0A0F9T567_9ZZZZ